MQWLSRERWSPFFRTILGRAEEHRLGGGRSLVISVIVCAGLMLLPWACSEQRTACAKVQINGKTWYVDLAMTDTRRYKGLSGRPPLDSDLGMLFVYPREQVLTFCMRGCDYPLDIVFLDSRRRVVQTYTMEVEPDRYGSRGYSSVLPAQYALELRAGEITARNIRRGDEATFQDLPDVTQADEGP